MPELGVEVLQRGHACHFRFQLPEIEGLRLDVMSVLHGCDDFEELWRRRRRLRLPGFGKISVMDLADLVQAKKTQRDKDWPMIARLIEADFHNRPRRPPRPQIAFWLREARTSSFLLALCRKYPGTARRVANSRRAVSWALRGNARKAEAALNSEEVARRAADRAYWRPLREELTQMRRQRRKKRGKKT